MNRNVRVMTTKSKWLMAVCSAVLLGVLPVMAQAAEKAHAIALGAPFCDNAILCHSGQTVRNKNSRPRLLTNRGLACGRHLLHHAVVGD